MSDEATIGLVIGLFVFYMLGLLGTFLLFGAQALGFALLASAVLGGVSLIYMLGGK